MQSPTRCRVFEEWLYEQVFSIIQGRPRTKQERIYSSQIPYSHKGEIPRPPIASTRDELLYGCKYENDIAVYESQLEDVAEFLYDVVVPHIISNG